jgi:hypothetical protein
MVVESLLAHSSRWVGCWITVPREPVVEVSKGGEKKGEG